MEPEQTSGRRRRRGLPRSEEEAAASESSESSAGPPDSEAAAETASTVDSTYATETASSPEVTDSADTDRGATPPSATSAPAASGHGRRRGLPTDESASAEEPASPQLSGRRRGLATDETAAEKDSSEQDHLAAPADATPAQPAGRRRGLPTQPDSDDTAPAAGEEAAAEAPSTDAPAASSQNGSSSSASSPGAHSRRRRGLNASPHADIAATAGASTADDTATSPAGASDAAPASTKSTAESAPSHLSQSEPEQVPSGSDQSGQNQPGQGDSGQGDSRQGQSGQGQSGQGQSGRRQSLQDQSAQTPAAAGQESAQQSAPKAATATASPQTTSAKSSGNQKSSTSSLPRWVQWSIWLVLGAVVVAGVAVLGSRAFLGSEAGESFLSAYPGEYEKPTVQDGYPWWLNWAHFFNIFLMALAIKTGIQIRGEVKPPAHWTPRWNRKRKISLTIWLHQSLNLLWVVNGLVFVVLLLATGYWSRVVPTSWETFPNALSAGLQYASLDWPTDHGWAHYNSMQELAYFTTIFIAAPLAILTGLRMSGLWPADNALLNRLVPAALARRVHFPVMVYFVVFIVTHVLLVFATGALRNLNQIYTGQDAENWVGFGLFVLSILVVAGGILLARAVFVAPIAQLFGRVGR